MVSLAYGDSRLATAFEGWRNLEEKVPSRRCMMHILVDEIFKLFVLISV